MKNRKFKEKDITKELDNLFDHIAYYDPDEVGEPTDKAEATPSITDEAQEVGYHIIDGSFKRLPGFGKEDDETIEKVTREVSLSICKGETKISKYYRPIWYKVDDNGAIHAVINTVFITLRSIRERLGFVMSTQDLLLAFMTMEPCEEERGKIEAYLNDEYSPSFNYVDSFGTDGDAFDEQMGIPNDGVGSIMRQLFYISSMLDIFSRKVIMDYYVDHEDRFIENFNDESSIEFFKDFPDEYQTRMVDILSTMVFRGATGKLKGSDDAETYVNTLFPVDPVGPLVTTLKAFYKKCLDEKQVFPPFEEFAKALSTCSFDSDAYLNRARHIDEETDLTTYVGETLAIEVYNEYAMNNTNNDEDVR